MEILGLLIGIFALHWIVGLATAILLRGAFTAPLYEIRAIRFTLPIVGYIVLNLLWWVELFKFRLTFRNAAAGILFGMSLSVAVLWRRRFSRRLIRPLLPSRNDWPLLFPVAAVLASSVWPYVAAGIGNYFLPNATDYFSRVTPSITHGLAAPFEILNARAVFTSFLRDSYPIQVASLSLPQYIFGCSATDSAALQAILNLVYTAIAVYWLGRYLFAFPVRYAMVGSTFAVLSRFYFHTYLNGHLGSLAYGSVAPLIVGLTICLISERAYRATLPMLAVSLLFLDRTYPMVVYVLAPPFTLMALWLIFRDQKKRFREKVSILARSIVRWRVSLASISVALVLASIGLGGYLAASRMFYANRMSLVFNGYQPMYIVFDPEALQWFYGLRLFHGFGYGFLDPADGLMPLWYQRAASICTILLTLALFMTAPFLCRSKRRTVLAMFLLTLPALVLAFVLFWPFSYIIYKLLYVNYFMIVLAVSAAMLRLSRMPSGRAVWAIRGTMIGVVSMVAAINLFGGYKDAQFTLAEIRRVDLGDFHTLISKLPAVDHVKAYLIPSGGLEVDAMEYALKQANIGVSSSYAPKMLMITSQELTLSPIPAGVIVARSDRGKYVASPMPSNFIEVFPSHSQGDVLEASDGVAFAWLSTPFDYAALYFEAEFRDLARSIRSLPRGSTVYNDLPDSGYYSIVQQLLKKNSLTYSDDPSQCTYFIRLNHRVIDVERRMDGKNSAVVAAIVTQAGRTKGVDTAYRKSDSERVVWSNEVFELVQLPLANRIASIPEGLDVVGLASVIRERRVAVANEIPVLEPEHLVLDDVVRQAGGYEVRQGSRPAALVCVPEYLIRGIVGDGIGMASILWRSPLEYNKRRGYEFVLAARPEAIRIEEEEAKDGIWPPRQPLRTFLWPAKVEVGPGRDQELRLRIHGNEGELKLLFQTGPSLEEGEIALRAMRLDGLIRPLFFTLHAPSELVRIPMAALTLPGEKELEIVVESDFHFAKRVMPFDDRLLLYRLSYCGLGSVGEVYPPAVLHILNTATDSSLDHRQNDIVDPSSRQGLALGTGWFGREFENRAPFRWMADGAQIVLENATPNLDQIEVRGQVGPSAVKGEIRIVARLNGEPVATEDLAYNSAAQARIVLDTVAPGFRKALRRGQNVITLELKGGRHQIPGDSRMLLFRVFSVDLVGRSGEPR